MKFKTALSASLIIHLLVFSFFMFVPDLSKPKSKGMRYYVNYVNFSGGKGGGKGGAVKIRKSSKGKRKSKAVKSKKSKSKSKKVVAPKEKKRSIRDLSVKKKTHKSKLRYPDKKSKRKKEKSNTVQSVTVKRKVKVKSKEEEQGNKGKEENKHDRSRLLEEGEEALSAGLGGGSGSGSGGGDGSGVFFPYAYYVEALKNKISANWFRGGDSGLSAVVYFRIYKNGNIQKLQIDEASGSSSFDLSALRAVKNAEPFPPLPDDYTKEYLSVFLKFE